MEKENAFSLFFFPKKEFLTLRVLATWRRTLVGRQSAPRTDTCSGVVKGASCLSLSHSSSSVKLRSNGL